MNDFQILIVGQVLLLSLKQEIELLLNLVVNCGMNKLLLIALLAWRGWGLSELTLMSI
jgi:hypothetical protein